MYSLLIHCLFKKFSVCVPHMLWISDNMDCLVHFGILLFHNNFFGFLGKEKQNPKKILLHYLSNT